MPDGVNPVVPSSISHSDAPALSVQFKSADEEVILLAVREVGAGQLIVIPPRITFDMYALNVPVGGEDGFGFVTSLQYEMDLFPETEEQ